MTQGEAVREARTRLRMTQAALAGASGVGRATVQRVEADRPVSPETIRSLCSVLGIDASVLPLPIRASASPVAHAPVHADAGDSTRISFVNDLGHALIPGVLLLGLAFLVFASPHVVHDAGRFVTYGVTLIILMATVLSARLARSCWRLWRHPGAVSRSYLDRPTWEQVVVGCRLVMLHEPWFRPGGTRITCRLATACGMVLPFVLMFGLHVVPSANAFYNHNSIVTYGDDAEPVPAWDVAPQSRLAEAGVRPGDRLVSVEGHPVSDLIDALIPLSGSPGRPVGMTFERVARSDGSPSSHGDGLVTVQVIPDVARGCSPAETGSRCGHLDGMSGLFGTDVHTQPLTRQMRRFGGEIVNLSTMLMDPDLARNGDGLTAEGDTRSMETWAAFVTLSDVVIPGCLYADVAMVVLLALLHLTTCEGTRGRPSRLKRALAGVANAGSSVRSLLKRTLSPDRAASTSCMTLATNHAVPTHSRRPWVRDSWPVVTEPSLGHSL